MLRRPARLRLAIPLAGAAAAVACSYFNEIEGTLAAADRGASVQCAVSTRPAELGNADWEPCGLADAPPGRFPAESVIPVGERFRCSVSANVDRVHAVQVQCPGFRPLVVDVLVESCAGLFGSCDAVQAGTLVVQR